ncbi:TPA: DUF3265 domain-containing protein [Vibrio parahaemolyticus]|uniref:DUF3265 domain-containing protein n=1 Tax=Vibrio parahaemolyticus TaxID=670 RepID=A0AA46UGI8_VIBPH|nr:DUF3265 domain-containing protein [Vibrio parahaemolyticus]EGX7687669.1 DUF3265 domain-containing protein [Vibrio parahaemolyticus]EIC5076728.1 DUF3265 domain-containing protein [Vibrio parahaemolyticus]ELZ1717993.1 DUF3265 domain-containing protein [Vibrio parahaemolyticus]MCC3850069.1 DUF3265 domain-containing protein [Vibrio parahaemolyticus]
MSRVWRFSRGIWHAWHFYYALGFVLKALCGNFVLRACTP